jgi:hypothetical protein
MFIDWDDDDGIYAGTFDGDIGLWIGGGVTPPTIVSVTTTRAYIGTGSLLIEWQSGTTNPRAQTQRATPWVIGKEYTLSAWVYVPTGSPAIRWSVNHLGTLGPVTTVYDTWVQMTYTFTATAVGGAGDIRIVPNTTPSTGQTAYIDDVMITMTGESVWDNLRWGTSTSTEYGRDQARALSPPRIGSLSSTLDNSPVLDSCGEIVIGGPYWPENTDSPIYGYVIPARDIAYYATFLGDTYPLFYGFLDQFSLVPSRNESSINFTANEISGLFETQRVTTPLYQGVRTGEALNYILDAIDWPVTLRDIDPGATVIPYFWAEGDNAFSAMIDVVNSEGPPALLYIDASKRVVFRDRHHRLLHQQSITTQATFKDKESDCKFAWPLGYDQGWRDIINSLSFNIDVRKTTDVIQIWTSSETVYTLLSGQIIDIVVSVTDPFKDAIPPVVDIDYTIAYGTVTVELLNYSGVTTTIRIIAVGGSAELTNLQLRGTSIPVSYSVRVSGENATSISKYGKKIDNTSRPWLSINEAVDLIDLILGTRSEPLPILRLTLNGANDTVFLQQLIRKLSDRIRVIDSNSFIDFECYIEQINHEVENSTMGQHTTVFGLERVPDVYFSEFILNTSLLNTGLLGANLDNPQTVFVLSNEAVSTDVPPTFISESEVWWETYRSSKTKRVTTQAGDIVVIVAQTTNYSTTTLTTPPPSSCNGITLTLRQNSTTANNPGVYLWTGTDSTGGNDWTLTISASGSDGWGFSVYVFRGSDGVGSSAKGGPSTGAPSLSITTTYTHSAIVVFNADNNCISPTIRAWREVNGVIPTAANELERTCQRYHTCGNTVYGAYYPDAGSAGAKTVGLSAPSGQHYTIVAVEIRGKGATQNPNPGGYTSLLGTALLGR